MIFTLSNNPVSDAIEARAEQLRFDLSVAKAARRNLEARLTAANKGNERLRAEITRLESDLEHERGKYRFAVQMISELSISQTK